MLSNAFKLSLLLLVVCQVSSMGTGENERGADSEESLVRVLLKRLLAREEDDRGTYPGFVDTRCGAGDRIHKYSKLRDCNPTNCQFIFEGEYRIMVTYNEDAGYTIFAFDQSIREHGAILADAIGAMPFKFQPPGHPAVVLNKVEYMGSDEALLVCGTV